MLKRNGELLRQGEKILIFPGGRNFPREHHSSCSDSRRVYVGVRRRNHPWQSWHNKFLHTRRSYFYAKPVKMHFVLAHRFPRSGSCPRESSDGFAVMVWKGTCYEMPRANFQSCWHLIYECGVCSPRISLIHWLSGLTRHKRHDFYRCKRHGKAEVCMHNYACPFPI